MKPTIGSEHLPLPAIKDRLVSARDIIDLDPCYSGRKVRRLMGGKRRRLSTLLWMDIPANDRLWAVTRLLDSERDRRLVACAMVRHTPIGGDQTVWDLLTDNRSRVAVEVAEQHALGRASDEELNAAKAAARDAAGDAAAADRVAAGDAARDAAGDAAAVVDAVWAAAKAVAWGVAWESTWDTAWDSTWDTAWDAQVSILLRMLKGGDL